MFVLAFAAVQAFAPSRKRYYLLRHGQSLANVEGVISSEPTKAIAEHGLSEAGRQQAEAAGGDLLAALEETGCIGVAICTSDFRRARETAEAAHAAARAAGVRLWPPDGPRLEVALRERWFGEHDATADSNYDKVWVDDKLSATHEVAGVESVASVAARTDGLLDRLDAEPELSGPWLVLLVAHGDILQITQAAQEGHDIRTHRSLEHLQTATLRELRRGTAAAE